MTYRLVAPSVDVHDLLDRWQANGWPAEEALLAYREFRQFGAPHVIHESQENDPLELSFQRVAEALARMETLEDFKEYQRNWSVIALGAPKGTFPDADANRTLALQMMQENRWGRDEIITRLSTSVYDRLPGWEEIREVGTDWDTLRTQILPSDQVQNIPLMAASSEQATQALLDACAEAGLRKFAWPVANGTTAEVLGGLAQQLKLVNHELCARTGWDGPVLGLAGKASILLGLDDSGNSGLCTFTQTPTLLSSPAAGWGPVSHEWMHGLDSMCGHALGWGQAVTAQLDAKQAPSKAPETYAHWHQLMGSLRAPIFDASLQAELLRQAHQEIQRRWSSEPLELRSLLDAAWEQCEQGWTQQQRQQVQQHIADCIAEHKSRTPNASRALAEIFLTDMDLTHDIAQKKVNEGSVWIQFADRFEQNCKSAPKQQQLSEFSDYFKESTEQLAHSFEAQFGKDAISSDVNHKEQSLRYPLQAERMAQTMVWKRFFRATQSWWNEQVEAFRPALPAAAPSLEALPLAARIRARRDLPTAAPHPSKGPGLG